MYDRRKTKFAKKIEYYFLEKLAYREETDSEILDDRKNYGDIITAGLQTKYYKKQWNNYLCFWSMDSKMSHTPCYIDTGLISVKKTYSEAEEKELEKIILSWQNASWSGKVWFFYINFAQFVKRIFWMQSQICIYLDY